MAEGRMLKKKISLNEALADLANDSHRVLFTWGIAHLDVEGRITGSLRGFKAMVAPLLDHITPETVEAFFQDAESLGLIQRYQVDAEWHVQYPKFAHNQNLTKSREAASKRPPPPSDYRPLPQLTEDSVSSQKELNEHSPITQPEVKGREGKLREVKGKEGKAGACAVEPAAPSDDTRPGPKLIFDCEAFTISAELHTELCQRFPVLPPEQILATYPDIRDWCLDNRLTPKHRKKFAADARLREPRRFLKNWFRKEEPNPAFLRAPPNRPLPPEPDDIMLPDPQCPVCRGSGLARDGPCKCLRLEKELTAERKHHGKADHQGVADKRPPDGPGSGAGRAGGHPAETGRTL